MKRTEDNARFAAEYTDEVLLSAVADALKTASVQASEVADIAGCTPLYAKRRLKDLAERGLLDARIIGNSLCFRLKE
jgi:predicted ArsR family transcriptional regulator